MIRELKQRFSQAMKKLNEASKFRPRHCSHLKQEDKAVPGETQQLRSTQLKAFLTDGASVLVPVQQPAPPSLLEHPPHCRLVWIHISLQEKGLSGDQWSLLIAEIINPEKN